MDSGASEQANPAKKLKRHTMEKQMSGLECSAQHIPRADTYELVFLDVMLFFCSVNQNTENTKQHSISKNLTSINDV